ncbi:class I SAM-dependent methyltransferase [Streptomyces broussonetiae]|uniref:Methyltransferase domain-containing protein n=1 Tax=Streptomyces broussonetiae TaxID=2686304 RepID=A0A6I6NBA1_9ACTN|nr:methyltransferase domain-containing protein [Streptomyces broussonetiae]QHA05576.1 methyltransferase domain-containing protein [Streptomyces broussonetiae]
MADTHVHVSSEGPERYDAYSAPVMRPFVAELLDAVDPGPGSAVLDLACGTGYAAHAAAALVGPAGRVCGADLDEGMIRVARAGHPRLYPDIDFTVAPADHLPYDTAAFDAVVCQQGAQFFPDLASALTEAARVTRPGGRFAATVWASLDRQPYFLAQQRALEEYGGPDAPGHFARAFSRTAEQLTAALCAAGFHAPAHREVTFGITLPPLDAYAPGHLAALWGGLITQSSGEEALTRAGRLVLEQLAHRTAPDGTATLPFTAILVTATR